MPPLDKSALSSYFDTWGVSACESDYLDEVPQEGSTISGMTFFCLSSEFLKKESSDDESIGSNAIIGFATVFAFCAGLKSESSESDSEEELPAVIGIRLLSLSLSLNRFAGPFACV